MKKVTLVAFVVAQVFALSAFAQDSKPRAEVKAEAAAANKAGTIEKGDASDTAKPAKITKMTKEEKAAARAKRKAETAKAAKAGEIVKGEGTPK